MAIALISTSGAVVLGVKKQVATYVVEVDKAGMPGRITLASAPYQPATAQVGYFVAEVVHLVRERPLDPVVMRQQWTTAINTDLPGEVIGQVTENVYDTVTGNYLLIPQGSKLLGKYQSLVTNGQNRALVVWQRLISPNGNSIVLDGMPGTDEAGQAGLQDKVDYHLDKLAEATALTTALAYGGNLARNPNSSSGNNGQDVVGDTVAQQVNRIGEKVIDRELDVQPTITIRQGWPLRVLVNKDMILEPYVP